MTRTPDANPGTSDDANPGTATVPDAGTATGTGFWFPGRWIGGIAMVLGPALLLAGVLLRVRHHFFFPDQLKAYDAEPVLMTAAYSLFAAGNVVLCAAVATLARMIGVHRPAWALWGGALVIAGLFTRTFHAGIDHLAFQLVDVQGVQAATQAVADSYTVWHVFRFPALAIFTGWTVLAIGAYRSRTLGLARAVALGLMSALALGTLKGTEVPQSLIAVGGLCVALVPLGVTLLRDGPRPARRALLWFAFTVTALVLLHFFGPEG
ncbi:hypothetical protein [Sphaerisporangium aureirubrum]|uniref:DUF998 domain-containing protein n=1 Tax=Sphaerisporangium aureirubrum TaxID=1544736 RepID=A0ABW1NC16_9ACTN